MKPLNEKVKAPKKAVRIESKSGVIKEDFITLGTERPKVGTVSAIRSNVSEVDVDAYYIKKTDEGKEKCVYLRKVGSETRVLFVKKKTQGHIPFIAYALSEFSLNELLLGRDRRAKDESLELADRKIGENELEYISMFMPADHQLKRKKGISMALTNDEKYEFMAFYWKKGKSVPCANSSYIPVLFDALETVTFNNASLTSPEQAADEIAIEGNDAEDNDSQAEFKGEVQPTAQSVENEAEQQEAESVEEPVSEEVQAEQEEEEKLAVQLEEAEEISEETREEAAEKAETETDSEEADEEISAQESEALAAAMPLDLFSEQELEEIFENPFDDEPDETQHTAEDEGESDKDLPESEASVDEGEAEEAENEKQPENAKAEAAEEERPKKEGFFEKRRKRKQLKKEKKSESKAKKTAESEEAKEADEARLDEQTKEAAAQDEPVLAEAQAMETEMFAEEETPFEDEADIARENEIKLEKEQAHLTAEESQKEQEGAEREEQLESAENEEKAQDSEQIIASEPEQIKEKPVKKERAKKDKKRKKKEKKAKKGAKESAEELAEEEISLENADVSEDEEKKENTFSIEEYFESEKPLTLLQILEAAEINNDNKKGFMPYMIPALMNTVFVVPITDSGENADAVYVSKKAADLLGENSFPMGKGKELIMPGDKREGLRKGIRIKTIMSSGEAFIPAFTSAEMFEQIFGKLERSGLFAFQNLRSQVNKIEQIKGIIINPEITDLIFEEEDIKSD